MGAFFCMANRHPLGSADAGLFRRIYSSIRKIAFSGAHEHSVGHCER